MIKSICLNDFMLNLVKINAPEVLIIEAKDNGDELVDILKLCPDLRVGTNNVYTNSSNISKTARQNRQLMIEVLEKEGFVNYPAEWWHWSYGDRYWAFVKKEPFAFYESIIE